MSRTRPPITARRLGQAVPKRGAQLPALLAAGAAEHPGQLRERVGAAEPVAQGVGDAGVDRTPGASQHVRRQTYGDPLNSHTRRVTASYCGGRVNRSGSNQASAQNRRRGTAEARSEICPKPAPSLGPLRHATLPNSFVHG